MSHAYQPHDNAYDGAKNAVFPFLRIESASVAIRSPWVKSLSHALLLPGRQVPFFGQRFNGCFQHGHEPRFVAGP